MLAPIVLFVYNRLAHTQKVIQSLAQNTLSPQSDLIIYSDAPKNTESTEQVLAVRAYIASLRECIITQGGGDNSKVLPLLNVLTTLAWQILSLMVSALR